MFIKQTADPTHLRKFALSPDSAHISLKMMAAMFTVGHRKSSTEQKSWMTQFSALHLVIWLPVYLAESLLGWMFASFQKVFEQSLRLRVPRQLYIVYKRNIWENMKVLANNCVSKVNTRSRKQ